MICLLFIVSADHDNILNVLKNDELKHTSGHVRPFKSFTIVSVEVNISIY